MVPSVVGVLHSHGRAGDERVAYTCHGWGVPTDDVRHRGHLQGSPDDDEQIDLRAILQQRPIELVAEFLAEEGDVWL